MGWLNNLFILAHFADIWRLATVNVLKHRSWDLNQVTDLALHWNGDMPMISDPRISLLKTERNALILRKTGTTGKSIHASSFHTVKRFDLESEDWFNADIPSKAVVEHSYWWTVYRKISFMLTNNHSSDPKNLKTQLPLRTNVNPSRKQSFSEILLKPKEFKNRALRIAANCVFRVKHLFSNFSGVEWTGPKRKYLLPAV